MSLRVVKAYGTSPAGFATVAAAATATTTTGTPAAAATGTAPATTAKAAVSTAAGRAKAALRFGSRFVDVEGAALHLISVQGRDCLVGLGFILHLHESEPARAAGLAISHDSGAV